MARCSAPRSASDDAARGRVPRIPLPAALLAALGPATVAGAQEVPIISRTAPNYVGSGLGFIPAGRRRLKGIAEDWDLYEAEA